MGGYKIFKIIYVDTKNKVYIDYIYSKQTVEELQRELQADMEDNGYTSVTVFELSPEDVNDEFGRLADIIEEAQRLYQYLYDMAIDV